MSGMPAAKSFKGIAHPPPRRDGKRNNIADLSAAEIATSRAGRHGLPGRPVLVEHDHAGGSVGKVLTSWEGPNGELRVEECSVIRLQFDMWRVERCESLVWGPASTATWRGATR